MSTDQVEVAVTILRRDDGRLAVSAAAAPLLYNQLLRYTSELERVGERAATLLGVVPPALALELERVRQAFATTQAAQARREPTALADDEGTCALLRATLRLAQSERDTWAERNHLRRQLGALPADLLAQQRSVGALARALEAVVTDASPRLRLRDWLGDAVSPRLSLLQRGCQVFLETGTWLGLRGEIKRWKQQYGKAADIYAEAKQLGRFANVDDFKDTLALTLDGFEICAEADPFTRALLDVLRLGATRYVEAVRSSARLQPVSAEDVAALTPGLQQDRVWSFLTAMGWFLSGQTDSAPFAWTPSRDVLRYLGSNAAEELAVRASYDYRRRAATLEECLLLVRVLADRWQTSGTWPTMDELLLTEERLGPAFVRALDAVQHTWVKVVDHRIATLDLDGILLGLSDPASLATQVAVIVGTLADELDIEERVPLARVATILAVDPERLRAVLPLLFRDDLGLRVYGTTSGDMEVQTTKASASYMGVRSIEALAAEWPANAQLHDKAQRRHNAAVPNPFVLNRTVKEKLEVLRWDEDYSGENAMEVAAYEPDDECDRQAEPAIEQAPAATVATERAPAAATERAPAATVATERAPAAMLPQVAEPSPAALAPVAPPPGHPAALAQIRQLQQSATNPQERGRELEGVLHALLAAEGLAPSRNIVNLGEELDNSFILDGQHYLVECKWLQERVGTRAVNGFMAKVSRKAVGTFGVVVSMSGFSRNVNRSATTGQPLNAVGVLPAQFVAILEGGTTWAQVIRDARRLASTRSIFVAEE